MYEVIHNSKIVIESLILVYAVSIILSYTILSVISGFYLVRYMKRQSITDYNQIISSPFAPSISVIAPAFNESMSIVENVRALLSLFYHDFEVILVNDGSKDDTLSKIIDAYDLQPVNFAVPTYLPCQKIQSIYKSRNKSFQNLVVIDKKNGGKADALNAGINVSTKDLFIAIDVDSIIESDALLKLVKPFLEEKKRRVIAVGGSIRIANSCIIEDGQIKEVKVPRNFWARFQVIEYTRAFLMGRIAWSRLDGLLIISGAMGLFDKEIAIKCGGYYADTVGEDMELVVRMRRYMTEKRLPYRVSSIPDSLCWTEVPTSTKILGRQRNRWTRGMIETLLQHKRIFFNPFYKTMGLLGYPYFFFFEWLGPLVEFFGVIYFVLIAILGEPNWTFFWLLLAFVYIFAILFSTASILFEQHTFNRYKRNRQMFLLLVNVIIEPIVFHPLLVWWGIKGNFDYFILQKKAWGKMTRKGFTKKEEK